MAATLWRVVLVDARRHIVDERGIAIAAFAGHVGPDAAEYLVARANEGQGAMEEQAATKDAAYADAYKAAAHLLEMRIASAGAALADLRALAREWAEGRDGLGPLPPGRR